ncbi:MAG: HD domain-containing protein [Deltaproteobacteria bacterium]|jgi:dGTPase|nr:HD domain-containing protein [Deltaproteobacteria bacterium]
MPNPRLTENLSDPPKPAMVQEAPGPKSQTGLLALMSPYQLDRDRIIHCKAFRRLAHKTQVFVANSSDHYRSRLTHTLEVSQVARTLAGAFSLNEDLAEAIALGHDLGHTPFGHAGEKFLNRHVPGGFNHHDHSVRIVTKLANNGLGLNLSREVIDGIAKHSKGGGPVFVKGPKCPLTPEGELVRASDIIAYLAHDLEDALESRLILPNEVPEQIKSIFGSSAFDRVKVMIEDLMANSKVTENGYEFSFSPTISQAMDFFRSFLHTKVYQHQSLVRRLSFCLDNVKYIFNSLIQDQALYETIPDRHLAATKYQAISDFIAGMTDRFAMAYAENISAKIKPASLKNLDYYDPPSGLDS